MPLAAFGPVLAASVLACTVTTIGIYVIGRCEGWASTNTVYFMNFAAAEHLEKGSEALGAALYKLDGSVPPEGEHD
jgi:hypothetical protein